MKSRLSEDESNDSAFADNGEYFVGLIFVLFFLKNCSVQKERFYILVHCTTIT